MRRALLPAALALAACGAGFQKESIVVDLRILGVRADPPEVVVDIDPTQIDPAHPPAIVLPKIHVTALVADPGAARRMEWSMVACAPTLSLRCDDTDPAAVVLAMGSGVADDPEDPRAPGALPRPALVAADLEVTPALLLYALETDVLHGFSGVPIQISIRVVGEGGDEQDAVYAAKSITFAGRQPAERVANTNPWLAALDADDAPFAEAPCGDPLVPPLAVTAGEVVRLTPIEPAGVRESYVLPTFQGGSQSFVENMSYSWYATAGSFSEAKTGGRTDAFGNIPVLYTDWTAPSAADLADLPDGQVRLWLVMRDERGGAYFSEHCFAVTAPAP